MATTKLVKVNFATSRPLVRYRYEDGAWQDTNIFLVSSGLTSYTFHAEDDKACKASITLTEDEIDFQLGNGVITIEKAITGSAAEDEDVMFQFKLEHSQITITNLLVSVNSPRTIEGLPDGDFTITESPPPTGYLHTNTPVIVTLSEGDRIKSALFTNEIDGDPVPTGDGTITINKRIINEEPTDLDVIFTGNLTGPIVKYGIEFSINTPAVIADLPDGKYVLEEIGLPDGYNFHGISPGAVVIDGEGSHTFDVLNSSGDYFFGDGSLEIQKRIFDEAGVEVLNSDVLFSSVLLYDVIEIDGLKFSVNTPLELKNLPFGEYKLYEDKATYGYNLDSISPWPITLSDAAPDGVFIVKNIAHETPEFPDPIAPEFYVISELGIETDEAIYRFTAGIGVDEVLLNSYFFEVGLFNNRNTYGVVLNNGNVIVRICGGSPGDDAIMSGIIRFMLFDAELNLIKTVDEPREGTTGPQVWFYKDYNDDIYSINGRHGFIRKHDKDLNPVWQSDRIGVSSSRYSVGGGVTNKFFVYATDEAFELGKVHIRDKFSGDTVRVIDHSTKFNSCQVVNYPDGRFMAAITEGSGDSYAWLFDEDANLLDAVFIPEAELFSAQTTCAIIADGTTLFYRLGSTSGSKITHQDTDFNELWNSPAFGNDGPYRAFRTSDPNKILIPTWDADGGGTSSFFIGDLNLQTVDSIGRTPNTALWIPVTRAHGGWDFFTKGENWQVTPPPPPPTGDSTIYINKVVTEGDATDNDTYFSVSIEVDMGFRTHVFSGQVSVNDPLALSNMPAGSYTIRESFDPNFELVGISPGTFVLGSGSSQTVDITNKKLDTPADSGKLYMTKRILNSISTDSELVFTVDVIDDATGGVKAHVNLRQDQKAGGSFPPGSYTIVETNSHAGIDHVSIIPNPVTVVADGVSNVEVTNERTAVSATAQLIINQTFDTLNPALKADAAFQITQNDNWPPDGSGTPEVEVRDANDPSKLINITYNEFDSPNDIAIKVMNAINGFTWNIPITATNPQPGAFKITANVAGTAGNNECFVITYGHHIDINGDGSGQFTQCLTGGQSGDLREVTIQYPYYPSVLAPPSVTVVWFPGETPSQVAARIETAINLNSTIKLTASASDNVVTFTEKRIGAEHIGKEIRVFYNPNTIDITPNDGILVMA